VFVKLERGVAGGVEVHLRQPEAITQPHIAIDPDVSLAEMHRALFESGAAVQLADGDFLLSHDWLLRHAAAVVDDAEGWAYELDVLLRSPSARSWYVKPVDALRGVVFRAPVV
jgi:hypothetical protein